MKPELKLQVNQILIFSQWSMKMNQVHLEILKQGRTAWNSWRRTYPDIRPDLSGAILTDFCGEGLNLTHTNFRRTVLYNADFANVDLRGADISHTLFINACLNGANLNGVRMNHTNFNSSSLENTQLDKAFLERVDLSHSRLDGTSFRQAELRQVNLEFASLTGVDFTAASLSHCLVYGFSTAELKTDSLQERNIIISNHTDPTVTVNRLKVAEAIFYRVNHNQGETSYKNNLVPILGSFDHGRRSILTIIRTALEQLRLIPVLFYFDKPVNRSFFDLLRYIVSMSSYMIADFTDAHSIPLEVQSVIPGLKLPVQPILSELEDEWSMFQDFRNCPWILRPFKYKDPEEARDSVLSRIINPAELKALEMQSNKIRNR
jgi:uncharacterized protein YjbI with pentapeptide repeats